MNTFFDTRDVWRENAKELISLINGHKEENYQRVQAFLKQSPPIDWGLLLQLLDSNRLFPIFWALLDDFDQYGVDVSTLILISKIAKASMRRYDIYNEELKKIFGSQPSLLEHCVFMKGYPMNQTVYKGANLHNLRQISDIDLVIDPEIKEPLQELFTKNGYNIKEKPNGMNVTKIDESQIWSPQLSFDVHYGNPSKLKIGERSEVWEVFSDNKSQVFIEEVGFSIWSCSPELHFIMTANHLYEHTQRFVNILLQDDLRWSRLVDLELLANQVNIPAVLSLAQELKWENALYYLKEMIAQLNESELRFPNLHAFSLAIPVSANVQDLVQNIIMPDGTSLVWDVPLALRILEPRRAYYVKNLLSENNDISDWYNLNQGGMYHKKLKKTLNQD